MSIIFVFSKDFRQNLCRRERRAQKKWGREVFWMRFPGKILYVKTFQKGVFFVSKMYQEIRAMTLKLIIRVLLVRKNVKNTGF